MAKKNIPLIIDKKTEMSHVHFYRLLTVFKGL